MIKDILILQKREFKSRMQELYVDRKLNLKKLKNPLIKIIIGPRRAGKSFFALHFLSKLKDFGYVNFDDEQLVELKDYDSLIEALNSVYKNPKNLLFDEIQNLEKWELFVNRLTRQGFNLIITGSNSKLLSKELATHLTGRHFLIYLFPFSFKEYLDLFRKDLTTNEIQNKLNKYLFEGGYPEPKIKKINNKDYLISLFDSIIYKDIVRRYNIRNPNKINDLAYYLISNISNEYSFNSLKKSTGIKSVHTIEKYLGYLEESFLLFSLKRFSYKVKEQLSSIKKIYCIDNGFISSKSFKINPDYGRLYENLVAIKLKKLELDNKIKLFYWQNQQKQEVDFVIKKGLKVNKLIQVCYNINNPNTKKREIRALISASKNLHCKNLWIITKDYEKEESFEWFGIKRKIKFITLQKWLLKNK